MTSFDSWRRVEELYEAGSDLPAADREEWLDRACAGDAWLRQEVKRLLDEEPEDSVKIAGIIEEAAVGLFDEDAAADAMAGEELGHYRILRELGRGGMGAVYLAVRSDEAFDKQVAIKLVKRGLDTDAVLQRFWYERRILAGLDHPYIAHLHDGGTSPDGRPYFVMEYVDGQPLDAYAREHDLSGSQRCELMRKVCEAVAYAHRNLVIHRDLKPANILITPDGTPKLLDFGIARLLSIDPGEHTVTGPNRAMAMTPDFASPEQLRGEAVTTATDVYSLGATLQAILSGHDVPRDLATILDKARREEAGRRYASVAEFSDDLRRYLAGMPILARDQTLFYRTGKFVRRHRVGVAVVTLGVALTLAAIAAIVWESHRAEIERNQAEQRLSQAVEMAERDLAEVNSSMASLPGTTEARRQMVRNTIDYLDGLAKDSSNDPRVRLALATGYVRVGEVLGNRDFTNLGDVPGAVAAYKKAIALVESLLSASPGDFRIRDLAEVAHQGYGRVLESQGRLKDADAEVKRAVTIADDSLMRDPKREESQDRVLDAHYGLNWLHKDSAPKEVEVDAKKMVPMAQAMVNSHPGDLGRMDTLSEYDSVIGAVLQLQQRATESLDYYRRAVEIREEINRRNPHHTKYQRVLLIGYAHIGDLLGNPGFDSLGDYPGAIEYYRKALRIAEEMRLADASDSRAAVDLGMVWTRIGMAQRAAGNFSEARQSTDRAITSFEPLLKTSPASATYAGGIMVAYNNKAETFYGLGDYTSAILWHQKALEVANQVIAAGSTNLSTRIERVGSMERMANSLARLGRRGEAIRMAERSLIEARAIQGSGGSAVTTAESWLHYGQTYETLRDCETATPAYRKSLELWKQAGVTTGFFAGEMRDAEWGSMHCGAAVRRP